MTSPSILHQSDAHATTSGSPSPRAAFDAKGSINFGTRRRHIWDLMPHLHCSIIGTCLTTGELRQIFVKLNLADVRTATDHSLHGLAVTSAGKNDLAGKMLNKALERRHEVAIKRFGKAKTVEEVRALWQDALAKGEIPGAYWAVFTHPEADRKLLSDAFGDVHMLSHLVGMANRADIARLRVLERDLGDRDEKIARQQARLLQATVDKAQLFHRAEELEAALRASSLTATSQSTTADGDVEALRVRLADEQARARLLATRLEDQGAALKAGQERIAALEAQTLAQTREISVLEQFLSPEIESAADDHADSLSKRTLLYVGGRPKLVEQLRLLTERRGGRLLAHDGGVEDKPGLLPGLISQADTVFFPVDCVSHRAAEQVKRACQQTDKPFVPLRTASVASFVSALNP